jgi:CheY-like chemotaxis protein
VSEKRIGDLLVEFGAVSREQLEEMMHEAVKSGPTRLASRLFSTGAVHEADLCRALAHRCAQPALVFGRSVLDLEALDHLPEDQARDAFAIPVLIDDEQLVLCSHDPEPQALIEQLSFVSGRVVNVVLGIEASITAAIDEAYAAKGKGQKVHIGHLATAHKPHLELMYGGEMPNENELAKLVEELVGPSKKSGSALGRIALKKVAVAKGQLIEDEAPAEPEQVEEEEELPVVQAVPVMPAPPRSGGYARLPSGGHAAPGAPARVVVADDDDDIRRMIVQVLTKDGYDIEDVADGHAAVEAIKRRRPAVVILDGMMPGMHGFEVCKHLKGSDAYKDIRVVIVTAQHKGVDTARVVQEEYGADAFLEKPFELQMLRKMVASMAGKPLERVPLPPDKRAQIEALRDQIDEHTLLGEWAPAQTCVERWLALDPFDAKAHLVLGNLLCQQHHLPLAMRAYEKSVVFRGDIFETWTNLALVYERLGFRQKAAGAWKSALELADTEAVHERISRRISRLLQ